MLLDPPLVALDKDAPVPYAGREPKSQMANTQSDVYGLSKWQSFFSHFHTIYWCRKQGALTRFLTNTLRTSTKMPQLCAQATIATSHHWAKADDPAVLCAHCLSWSMNFIYHLQKCKTNAVFFLFFIFSKRETFFSPCNRQLYKQSKKI